MEETIFDKIIAKKIPAQIVYEDDDVLAFKDINPTAPVHVLCIPKQKVPGFAKLADLDAAYLGRYMLAISKVATKLELDDDGYRVVFNEGKNALQSVPYLHAHILGGRSMKWPPG